MLLFSCLSLFLTGKVICAGETSITQLLGILCDRKSLDPLEYHNQDHPEEGIMMKMPAFSLSRFLALGPKAKTRQLISSLLSSCPCVCVVGWLQTSDYAISFATQCSAKDFPCLEYSRNKPASCKYFCKDSKEVVLLSFLISTTFHHEATVFFCRIYND